MKAARFYGAGQPIRIDEVPYPEAGPGEVVVRIAACGICGSDVHFLEGLEPPAPLPLTLGHEPAGIVESVGEDVHTCMPGDRVALHVGNGCGTCRICMAGHPTSCPSIKCPGLHIDGAFAEAVLIAQNCIVPVPDGVSLAAAAVATDCVATPYHALKCRAQIEDRARVAVIGAGGLGLQGVALARVLGADQVVAVDVSELALDRARRAGANATILSKPGEDVGARIQQLTDGGADVVLECVGLPDTVAIGAAALRPGGRLVVVGVGMEPPRVDIPMAFFAVFELTILGSFGSHVRDLKEVLRLAADGRIDIEHTISHRLSLDEVPEGLEMLRTKKGDPQRIVVEPES